MNGEPQTASAVSPLPQAEAHVDVNGLTVSFGSFVLMRDVSFTVRQGDIFVIMGGSGCGKSTLLKVLV